MMNAAANRQNGQPDAAQIRAQVTRMTASNVFRNSPQLASFLLFVVEAVLRGKAERLKGYTIGVEVLRRDVSFDPQIDPIVRVEATRLRRALERYYSGPGADDAVVISLPRGGYVPRIAWRSRTAVAAPKVEPGGLAPGNGLPTLRVAPFVVTGRPGALTIDGDALSGKIAEAFALFDMINVIGAAPAASQGRSHYRLDGTLEYQEDLVCLRSRLVDKADETVIWSRTFEVRPEDAAAAERNIILELATAIVQRFGIIWSHDRARQLTGNSGDPRYRVLIQTGEAFRSFDPAALASARKELTRLVALDPGFATGHSHLAIIYATEYVHAFGDPDDANTLDRALKAARRGVELKPQGGTHYHALFFVLFVRGEIEAAIAAAEQAIALNPYDLSMRMDYGGRLIFAGQVERGMKILRDTVAFGVILPSWTHFYLFLGHYLRGEYPEARFHAGQMTSERHVYGRLARALMAQRDGDTAQARRIVEAVQSELPHWKADPRGEIGKLISSPDIADRLAHDLAETGLKGTPKKAGRGGKTH